MSGTNSSAGARYPGLDLKRSNQVLHAFQLYKVQARQAQMQKTEQEKVEPSFNDRVADFAMELWRNGWDSVCTDLSEWGITVSRQQCPPNFEVNEFRNVAWKLASNILGLADHKIYDVENLCYGISPDGTTITTLDDMDYQLKMAKFSNGMYDPDWPVSLKLSLADELTVPYSGFQYSHQLQFLNFAQDDKDDCILVPEHESCNIGRLARELYEASNELPFVNGNVLRLDLLSKVLESFIDSQFNGNDIKRTNNPPAVSVGVPAQTSHQTPLSYSEGKVLSGTKKRQLCGSFSNLGNDRLTQLSLMKLVRQPSLRFCRSSTPSPERMPDSRVEADYRTKEMGTGEGVL